MATGSVYLMFCESTGLHKIGFSDNPARRAATLGLSSDAIIHTIPYARPRLVERAFHWRLAARRDHGEWFKLTADDVAAFCAVGEGGYWPPWLSRQIDKMTVIDSPKRTPGARIDTRTITAGVGRRVKAIREAAGLSQAELAEATDLALGTVRKIEQGLQAPSFAALLALADVLGVSLDDFRPRPVE